MERSMVYVCILIFFSGIKHGIIGGIQSLHNSRKLINDICYYFVSCFVFGLVGVILDIVSFTDDFNNNNNNTSYNNNFNTQSNASPINLMFSFSKIGTNSKILPMIQIIIVVQPQ